MDLEKLPEPETNARPGSRSLPFEIDLNETPLASPRETLVGDGAVPAAARDGGFGGEVLGNLCGSSGKAAGPEGDMLACCGCRRGFHLRCLVTKEDHKSKEWKCFKCLLSNGGGKLRSRVGLLDINASPPRESDGEGFLGDGQSSAHGAQAREAEQNGNNSINTPMTSSSSAYLDNGFDLLRATLSVPQNLKSSVGNIEQHRLNRTLKESDIISTRRGGLWSIHATTPLTFLSHGPNEVYLQGLKEYLQDRGSLLGDDWRVEFIYCKIRCKTIAVYCGPDGSRFESMADVAGHLQMLRNYHFMQTEDRRDGIASLQKGLHSNRRRKELLRSNDCRENQKSPRSNSAMGILSGIGLMGCQTRKSESSRSVMETDSRKCGHSGFPLVKGALPLQFEDLFVLSLGKVDPRPSYHNSCQIWPVGYMSCWHDKITGSIFVSEVVDGGDAGPIFKVRRYPCSTHPIPIGSTVLVRQKYESINGRHKVVNDEAAASIMVADDDDSLSIQTMLMEDNPPNLEGIDFQKANSSTTDSSCLPQRSVNISITDDLGMGDFLGEFSVEGGSSSLVWEMASETLLRACKEVYKQRGVLQFCCRHNVNGATFDTAENSDSLSKFCCLAGPTGIPHLIESNEFETYSEMLLKWLQQDRFGLDMEFVQEFLEQLPGVQSCLEYKILNNRSQFSGSLTVRSGFLLAKRKNNVQCDKGTDGVFLSCKRPRKQLSENSAVKKSVPLGKPLSTKLPADLIGDVLQVWEFLRRFSEVLGLEEPFSFEDLESELTNPWSDTVKPLERAANGIQNCADVTLCTGTALREAHSSLLKVLVGELLLKVAGYVDPASDIGESKSRRGRKKDADIALTSKKMKFDMLQINELTWPELARRYILVVLSMEGNLESADITYRQSSEIFHCLQGDGGTLCGSLTGVAGMEADAMLLAEALKQVFGLVKNNHLVSTVQVDSEALSTTKMMKPNSNALPDWAQALLPVKKLPTNVGARIRKCVYDALDKNPPQWAKEILLHSISKDVYKGNASGPTKKAIVSLLADLSNQSAEAKPDKKEKVKCVSISDVIMQKCRIVLRRTAAEDEEKVFCNLLGRTLLNPNDNDDEGLLGYPAMVSRPLDFRTIDIRLAAGAYGGSHESFLEDVREIWKNIRIAYADRPDLIDLVETLSQKFEAMYEKEILTVIQKFSGGPNCVSMGDEAKKEMDDMLIHASDSSLPKAPWDDGVCKVCGVDKDDDNVLLCDTCDSEYHTYCLSPPLARIPEGNWYCPSCFAGQSKSQGALRSTQVNCSRKRRYQGEFTRNFMETLSRLARTMASKEYWEFTVDERVSLVKFFCDETLNSSVLRDHLDHCACQSADLLQKLKVLSSEWKNLKLREEILAANLEKANAAHGRVGEFDPDGSALTRDGKLMGRLATRSNTVLCFSGSFPQNEDDPQWNGSNDYNQQPYLHLPKSTSEKPCVSQRKGCDTAGQIPCQLPVTSQTLLPEKHFSRTRSGSEGANLLNELPPSNPQKQKNDIRGGNSWSNDGPLPNFSQLPQGLVSSNTNATHMADHVPLVHVNSEHSLSVQSSSQSDTSAFQSKNREMGSLKHEISVLLDSITRLEYELQKVSVRKEFLGRDSSGRAYWVFGGPDTCSLMVVNGNIEVQKRKVTEQGSSTENNSNMRSFQYDMDNPSSSGRVNVSAVFEYVKNHGDVASAWVSYRSDAEIGEVVRWLSDSDARERELKESILHWQRNRPKDSNIAETRIGNEKQPSSSLLFNGGKDTSPNFLVTKAGTALEKKYGPCLGSEASDMAKKWVQKGKVICEGKMYRCECLEPIWSFRHHCPSCHQTYSNGEELERHNNNGKCTAGSFNSRGNENSLKGKKMMTEASVKKRHDDNGIARASKNEKNEIKSNLINVHGPECPIRLEDITIKFVTENSLKELVRDIGLIRSPGTPPFVTSVSPYLSDPTLRLFSTRKSEVSGGNEPKYLDNQLQRSIEGTRIKEGTNCNTDPNNFSRCIRNDKDEASKVDRLVSSSMMGRDNFSPYKNRSPAHGTRPSCVIPESSSRRLVGRLSQILRHLKINLLDMDAALPEEALRPSMSSFEKRSAWRAFVKSAVSIYEMVQATIVLEYMIKTDYLRKEWWYWSSLSAAANISTLSALALRVCTLDAAIIFEKPSPASDSTEIPKLGNREEGGTTPNSDTTSNMKESSPRIHKNPNDPTDHSKPKNKPKKRRKDSGG